MWLCEPSWYEISGLSCAEGRAKCLLTELLCQKLLFSVQQKLPECIYKPGVAAVTVSQPRRYHAWSVLRLQADLGHHGQAQRPIEGDGWHLQESWHVIASDEQECGADGVPRGWRGLNGCTMHHGRRVKVRWRGELKSTHPDL